MEERGDNMQKDKLVKRYRKAIENLYTGVASVVVRESVKNPTTKVTEFKEKTVYENIACRLSFYSAKNNKGEFVTESESGFTLFIAPEINIPINSKITVIQNGYTYSLMNARLKSYSTHNEYSCVEFVRWA